MCDVRCAVCGARCAVCGARCAVVDGYVVCGVYVCAVCDMNCDRVTCDSLIY